MTMRCRRVPSGDGRDIALKALLADSWTPGVEADNHPGQRPPIIVFTVSGRDGLGTQIVTPKVVRRAIERAASAMPTANQHRPGEHRVVDVDVDGLFA